MNTLKIEGRMDETVNEHYKIYEKIKNGQLWESLYRNGPTFE